MNLSTEEIYSKFLQAEYELGKYSVKLLDKVTTGNHDNKLIRQFNVMSAWVSYMKGELKFVTEVTGKSPSPIHIYNISAVEGVPVTIGIEDISGKFYAIATLDRYTEADALTYLAKSSNILSQKTGITVKKKGSELIVSFPRTEKFNGMPIIVSPTLLTHDTNPSRTNGGATAVAGKKITNQTTLYRFRVALDHIAIHLGLTYERNLGLDARDLDGSYNDPTIRSASSALLVGMGKALLDERGNILEL